MQVWQVNAESFLKIANAVCITHCWCATKSLELNTSNHQPAAAARWVWPPAWHLYAQLWPGGSLSYGCPGNGAVWRASGSCCVFHQTGLVCNVQYRGYADYCLSSYRAFRPWTCADWINILAKVQGDANGHLWQTCVPPAMPGPSSLYHLCPEVGQNPAEGKVEWSKWLLLESVVKSYIKKPRADPSSLVQTQYTALTASISKSNSLYLLISLALRSSLSEISLLVTSIILRGLWTLDAVRRPNAPSNCTEKNCIILSQMTLCFLNIRERWCFIYWTLCAGCPLSENQACPSCFRSGASSPIHFHQEHSAGLTWFVCSGFHPG